MKTLMLLFLIALFSIPIQNLYSVYYIEQNSGVTSSLNAVCVVDNFNYIISRVWVCGNFGVVLKTSNSGTNWVNAGPVWARNLYLIESKGIDTVLVAGDSLNMDYRVFRTTNGGASWIPVFTTLHSIYGIKMKNSSQGFMASEPVNGRWSLWKTTNGGASWDSSGLYLPRAGTETGITNSIEVLRDNIWIGTNNSRIYYSPNFGSTWQVISFPESSVNSIWHFGGDSTYSIAGGTNIYRSTNGGLNWILNTCPGTGNISGFSVGTIYVSNTIFQGPVHAARIGGSALYFSSSGNSFITTYSASSGLYRSIAYTNSQNPAVGPQFSWAVRSNGGITLINTGIGGISRISNEIPEAYILEQNYPNPFNPSTKIRFSIPFAWGVLVKIIVFDILGREVKTLVNEKLSPGIYEDDFDASLLPSGTYFYCLTSDDYTETKKMVLIK
jgi:photosystem II stability/assembly factor-like uncharacterized protein